MAEDFSRPLNTTESEAWANEHGFPIEEVIPENSILLITHGSRDADYSHEVYSLDSTSPSETGLPSLVFAPANPPQALVERYRVSRDPPPCLDLAGEDVHVLISTKSGTGLAVEFHESVLAPFLALIGLNEGKDYQLQKTESQDSVGNWARERLRVRAGKGIRQTVILLSGDGGVVDLINAEQRFMGPRPSTYTPPTLILIPLGTANALFHSLHPPKTYSPLPLQHASSITSSSVPPNLGLSHPYLREPPSPLTLALRTLLRGTPRPLPTFAATFSPRARLLTDEGRIASPIPYDTIYGAIVASYGFHATLVADSDTEVWRKHGDKRFAMVAGELLSGVPHAYRTKVKLKKGTALAGRDELGDAVGDNRNAWAEETKEEAIDREEHGYVLVTLVSRLERTFCISPASKPLDGVMRLVHFGPEGSETVQKLMAAAYNGGKHVAMVDEEQGRKLVGYEAVDEVTVEVLEGDDPNDTVEGQWRRMCVDGLIVRVEEGGWMRVRKVPDGDEGLEVVVPGLEFDVPSSGPTNFWASAGRPLEF